MAPKKKIDKQAAPLQNEVVSLYVKREPLPPPDPLHEEDIEETWKVCRDTFVYPLPEWDDDAVNTVEWKPNEVDTLYTNEAFSAKSLPRSFLQNVSVWKRAAGVSDNSAPDEMEPVAKVPEFKEETPVPEVDPKAKAKAKPDKAKNEKPPSSSRPTTSQQFAESAYAGDACVVTPAEFRTRQFDLTNDDAMPPLSQAIASQLAVIGEHTRLIPGGFFLWELIYPQGGDGMPLFNPHGKYIVKLFVQGLWRQVLIDDIVPVGTTGSPQSIHAGMLPSSATPGSIWPQLLSKALLRVFQADLRSPTLPAICVLTGWSTYQLPFSWDVLRASHEVRPFCVLQMSSQVDLEARQREAMMAVSAEAEKKDPKGGRGKPGLAGVPALNLGGQSIAQVPKLGAQPSDATLQFLICELEDDPQQVRLKAATWRPVGGTPRKAILDIAESDVGEEEEIDPFRHDDFEDRASENDNEHEEEDDEERRSQRSPSGEATVQSARSKDDGQNAEESPSPELIQDGGPGDEPTKCVSLWPDILPEPVFPKSVMMDYQDQLNGGYWVSHEVLTSVCDTFAVFIPPGEVSLSARLDTCWSDRSKLYTPSPLRLLRLKLVPQELSFDQETPREDLLGFDEPEPWCPKGPPWHRTSITYEPLGTDPGISPSCLLQNVTAWGLKAAKEAAPTYIQLMPGSPTPDGPGVSAVASRSVLVPSGEHWFLAIDEATQAGSVLSVRIDGTFLNKDACSLEFVEPAKLLEENAVPMANIGPVELAPQKGFCVWSKSEVTVKPTIGKQYLQLLSYVSDTALRSNLRLLFLRLKEIAGVEPARRCASWSVETLASTPLLPLMSLPLDTAEADADGRGCGGDVGGAGVKYVVMLEANLPVVSRGGTFSLKLLSPPSPESPRKICESEVDAESAQLQVTELKVDHIIRWSAETVSNDKGSVLRERITVPYGAGDQTATLRVTITGLPGAYLRADLIAQLPPEQEMRPKGEGGVTPEPLAPGAPIDPKEYASRRNWLASKRIVVEAHGLEIVTLPHVLLCDGSTYLLDVLLDPNKGPDNLEGGQWVLEYFGSGEIEVGPSTMEQDLEALVRKSWEPAEQDPGQPSRKDLAAKSRRRWLRKHGLGGTASPDGEDSDKPPDPPPAAAAPPPDKKEEKGNKRGSVPQVANPVVEEVPPEVKEAEWLEEAIKRADEAQHSNYITAAFVHAHTVVEPVLTEEDPYTITPLLDVARDVEASQSGRNVEGTSCEVALDALGVRGLAEVRNLEIESSTARWEQIRAEVEVAKDRNAKALSELTNWDESQVAPCTEYMDRREELRGMLTLRLEKKHALKAVLDDAENIDTNALETALEEATTADVGVWDKELVESASQKKRFIEDFSRLQEGLARLEEEPLADAAARQELLKVVDSAKGLQRQLKKKNVPLPPEFREKDLFTQAAQVLSVEVNGEGVGDCLESPAT